MNPGFLNNQQYHNGSWNSLFNKYLGGIHHTPKCSKQVNPHLLLSFQNIQDNKSHGSEACPPQSLEVFEVFEVPFFGLQKLSHPEFSISFGSGIPKKKTFNCNCWEGDLYTQSICSSCKSHDGSMCDIFAYMDFDSKWMSIYHTRMVWVCICFCKYLGVTLAGFGGNSNLTLILLMAGFVFNHSEDQWSPAESLWYLELKRHQGYQPNKMRNWVVFVSICCTLTWITNKNDNNTPTWFSSVSMFFLVCFPFFVAPLCFSLSHSHDGYPPGISYESRAARSRSFAALVVQDATRAD